MRISRADAFLLRLPLSKPFVTACQKIDHLDTVLVRLEANQQVGWGEAAPGNIPMLNPQWSRGTYQLLKEVLLPLLMTSPGYEEGEKITEQLKAIPGNQYAKGAIDMAWWDLDAKLKGEPLWKRLGGTDKPIELGLTFDRYELNERDQYYADMTQAADEKFHRVTIKYRPGWEVEPLRAMRQTMPQKTLLQVDVEGALDLNAMSDRIYRMQDFFPTVIEQPVLAEDHVSLAMLQESLRVKIGLDETITSLLQAEIALDLQAGKVLCIKPGQVGGLTEAKKIRDLVLEEKAICYAGTEIVSPIGYRHTLALASLDGFTLPTDYYRFDSIFTDPLASEPETFIPSEEENAPEGSSPYRCARLWSEPGIGVEPNGELLERFTIEKTSDL